MTITASARLTIFEGPDGSGKTTLARGFASMTGARYVHCGPFPRIDRSLARLYVEAMLPALLGYQDVVMDRCWLSEPIYGAAFRDGVSRLTDTDVLMLERLAARCQTKVVLALPRVEVCLKAFVSRPKDEYLKKSSQLKKVHKLYSKPAFLTTLPVVRYDYTKHGTPAKALAQLDTVTDTTPHPLGFATAGRLEAKVVLVGESFAEVKEHDSLYQAPFVSFTNEGCSSWLTEQLRNGGIDEQQLLWVNADVLNLRSVLMAAPRQAIFALGAKAAAAVRGVTSQHFNAPRVIEVTHPQHAKRFHSKQKYDLIQKLLKEQS